MSGKGDTPRPMRVSLEEYESNYDLAFRRKPVEVEKEPADETKTEKPADQ